MTAPTVTFALPHHDDARPSLTVRVAGTPTSWKRPRQAARGRGRYTDPAAAGWSRIVAATVDQALRAAGHYARPWHDADTAVALEVTAAFPRPQRPLRPVPLGGYADVDNLAKVALDALEGVVYANDAQVAHLMTTKAYVDGDGFLEVTVWPVVLVDVDRDTYTDA